MDFNTFYLAKDIQGATAYYGYAAPGTLTSSPSWVIRQETTSGTITSYKWTNNSLISYESIWDNRLNCFQSPSAPSLTYSTNGSINISWTGVTGVSRYNVLVNNGNYSSSGAIGTYNYNGDLLINITSYNITNVVHGTTYSVQVTSINQVGSSSSNINIYYP